MAVTAYHWLLFFHLLGAFCLFAGAAVAGTLQIGALRREKPSEILTLLRLTRVGVLLVVAGAVLTIAFGVALASHLGYGLTPAWIRAALGLWLASMALGAIGGRTARHARYRAEELAAGADEPDEKLHALVRHRPSLLLSYASSILLLAILVLMVWRPT
jgi:uncharacterized membrane protein